MSPPSIQSMNNSRPLREADLIGPTASSARYAGLSNPTKSRVLAQRVRELVPLRKSGESWILAGIPSPAAVQTLAEEIANMWPRGPESGQIFRAPATGHNVLYWGRRYPSGIRKAVSRTALYADRVFVLNPFIDDFLFHPEHSPLIKPADWTAVYAASAAFIGALTPWIESDIVELIPNPAMVNFQLGQALRRKAEYEVLELGPALEAFKRRYLPKVSAESFFFMSDADRDSVFDNMGGATPAEREEIAIEVARLRSLDPEVSEVISGARSSMIRTGTGASFPAVRTIAESLSASIISDDEFSKDRMRLSAESMSTSAQSLTDAFQLLDFNFLNDVSAKLAVELRQRDGFVRFRRLLEDITALSAVTHQTSSHDQRTMECAARLKDEYEAYKREWRGIDRTLLHDALFSGAAGVGSAAITTGQLEPLTIGTVCISGLLKNLWDAWTRRSVQAAKPLGVLLRIDSDR